jgi:hypothetical protein
LIFDESPLEADRPTSHHMLVWEKVITYALRLRVRDDKLDGYKNVGGPPAKLTPAQRLLLLRMPSARKSMSRSSTTQYGLWTATMSSSLRAPRTITDRTTFTAR